MGYEGPGTKACPSRFHKSHQHEEIPSMKSHAKWVSVLLVGSLGLWYSAGLFAAVTAEHRKQIDEVKKELAKVKGMIAKKDYDDAEKLLGDADQKLKQVVKEAGIDENNKLVASLLKQV